MSSEVSKNLTTFGLLLVLGIRRDHYYCITLPYYGIGATIRIGREMLCLPYARFFLV